MTAAGDRVLTCSVQVSLEIGTGAVWDAKRHDVSAVEMDRRVFRLPVKSPAAAAVTDSERPHSALPRMIGAKTSVVLAEQVSDRDRA